MKPTQCDFEYDDGYGGSATATLTLALPKRGFGEPSARAAVGKSCLGDIGVPPELYAKLGLEPPVDAILAQDDIVRLW